MSAELTAVGGGRSSTRWSATSSRSPSRCARCSGRLPAADWARPTLAVGWTITDQVTHLAYFDDVTRLSVTDPERFTSEAGGWPRTETTSLTG